MGTVNPFQKHQNYFESFGIFVILIITLHIKMVGTNPLAQEQFWANKAECDDAERKYYQKLYGKKVEDDESMDVEPEKKKEKPDSDSDDVDLFASSDEDEKEKPKPKMVTPKPKAVTSNPPKNKKTPEKEIVQSAPSEKVPTKKEEKQQKETVTAPTKEILEPAPSEEVPI